MTMIPIHLLPQGKHPTSMQAVEALRFRQRLWALEIDRCPRWRGGDDRPTAVVDSVPLAEPTELAAFKALRVSLIVDIVPGDVLCAEGIEFMVTASPVVPVLRLVDSEASQNGAATRDDPKAANREGGSGVNGLDNQHGL